MLAIFTTAADRIVAIRDAMDKRDGGKHSPVIVWPCGLGNTQAAAEGPPQQVMFLIGEVAAQGESCLLTVNP